MKKLAALVMVLSLVLGVCAAAQAELETLPLKVTQAMYETVGADADGWMGSEDNRALLTISILIDYCLQSGARLTDLDLENSFITYQPDDGIFSFVVARLEGGSLIIHYSPESAFAACEVVEGAALEVVAGADSQKHTFFQNALASLQMHLETLSQLSGAPDVF